MAIPKHIRVGSGVTARRAPTDNAPQHDRQHRFPKGSGAAAKGHGGGGIARRLAPGLKTSGRAAAS